MIDRREAEDIRQEQENCNNKEPTWQMCMNCDYEECTERVEKSAE